MKKEDAQELFEYVFNQPYNHLDIDFKDKKFYKNFNLLVLEK